MANIQFLELRPAETPIEDLSCEVANNILGGTCPGEGGGGEGEGEGGFLLIPVGGGFFNVFSAFDGEYLDTINDLVALDRLL